MGRRDSYIQHEVDFSLDYLRWQAGELDERPHGKEYGLQASVAIELASRAEAAIMLAQEPRNDPPLNPERFGVSQQRGQEIIGEIDRLINKAHERSFRSGSF